MTAPKTRTTLKVPGSLIADPTNLSAASPYGGTRLGLVKMMSFNFGSQFHPITAEEWGGITSEVIHCGYTATFACALRGLDNDALSAVFPDAGTGSPSGDQKIRIRATSGRAGTLLSTLSLKLLFEPEAPLRHKAILIRDAIPVIAEDAALRLSKSEEQIVNVLFHARPDSSDRIAEIGFIGDMTL